MRPRRHASARLLLLLFHVEAWSWCVLIDVVPFGSVCFPTIARSVDRTVLTSFRSIGTSFVVQTVADLRHHVHVHVVLLGRASVVRDGVSPAPASRRAPGAWQVSFPPSFASQAHLQPRKRARRCALTTCDADPIGSTLALRGPWSDGDPDPTHRYLGGKISMRMGEGSPGVGEEESTLPRPGETHRYSNAKVSMK